MSPRPLRVVLAIAVLLCVAVAHADGEDADRIFGVLPNYTTVEHGDTPQVPPETTRESFKLASLSTFDPLVYPFVGAVAFAGMGPRRENFAGRYATLFADDAIGNFMTTAVMPSLLHQDSRYFRRGEGGVFSRLSYAASRSVVTRTRDGRAAFNLSEIGGNFAAAGLSNLYYSPADRTMSGTVTRWASQVVWDTVANEMKEFWPDVRARLQRRPPR